MWTCRKDLEPGLHISRLSREDFAQFFRLARTMTAFVRIKQVTRLSLLCMSQGGRHSGRRCAPDQPC